MKISSDLLAVQTIPSPKSKERVGLNSMCEENGKRAKITLSEALFVHDYGTNLLLRSKLKNAGNKLEFGDNGQVVTRDGTFSIESREQSFPGEC